MISFSLKVGKITDGIFDEFDCYSEINLLEEDILKLLNNSAPFYNSCNCAKLILYLGKEQKDILLFERSCDETAG